GGDWTPSGGTDDQPRGLIVSPRRRRRKRESLIGLRRGVADRIGSVRRSGPAHDPFLAALRPRALRQERKQGRHEYAGNADGSVHAPDPPYFTSFTPVTASRFS